MVDLIWICSKKVRSRCLKMGNDGFSVVSLLEV